MFTGLLADESLWNSFILNIAAKSTLLLLLAAAMVILCRRSSAALRHRIWALQFVALLLIVPMHAFVPGLPWRIIPDRWQAARAEVVEPPADADFAPADATVSMATATDSVTTPAAGESASLSMMHEAEPSPFGFDQVDTVRGQAAPAPALTHEPVPSQDKLESAMPWLPLIWLTGMLAASIPLVIGLLGNLRLRRRSQALVDADWRRLVTILSDRLGLRRTVTLLLGGPQQMPMTFGLARPCIVLPSTAQAWSAERRHVVLLHELAHIKRCDVSLQLVARLATAVYWFHPLVWWALRQMRYEREQACDDCVLEAGQQAPDYASELLEIARAHRRSSPLLSAALSMARPSQLEGRLLAVLDMHRRRGQVSRAAAIRLTMLTLALVACVALVRPTLQAKTAISNEDDGANVASQDKERPAEQTVLTGTVLSPQGKPVPAATVEVVAYDITERRLGRGEGKIDHYQTRADANGRFRLVLPRNISRPPDYTHLFASAEGYAPTMQLIQSALSRKQVEIKLHEPTVFRLQLIDTAGNPLADVQPQLWSVSWNGGDLTVFHRNNRRAVSAWPQFSRSDAQGYVSATMPAPAKMLVLLVEDERLGDHLVRVDVADKPTSVALGPPQFINGKVTAADSGEPVGGAEVVLMREPYRRIRTGADGSFRIASGATIGSPYPFGESRYIIHVYPPPESPYLAQAREWQKPNDGFGDAELAVSLKRGIVVEGRVIEKRSQEPIAGAKVYFEPQVKNNPFFRETSGPRLNGSDMKYTTDAEGRFRMPVWPGPGYLLVRGPMLDFVHAEITQGDLYYGKPGLDRQYHHGALRINLEPDEPPQPLTIQLERGVTLRRRVLRPDGQPAVGKAYARSYLLQNDDIHSSLPDIAVENGLLEIPGFEPERSKPIFIFDPGGGCAAVMSPTASEVDLATAPIRLQRCGSAAFRFVNDTGKALADYEPMLILIVTPGATPGNIQPDQPLSSERIIWQNIVRPEQVPKTDSDGRVIVNNLIPGATYRVLYVGKEGWTDGHEFTVRSGETVDVGEVVIPQRD